MRIALLAAAAAAIAAAPPPPAAPASRDLRTLFPKEEPISAPAGQLCRLPLPVDLLTEVRPGLADVRVFDADGHEVAYALDSGAEEVVAAEQAPVKVLAAKRDELRDAVQPARWRETYDLAPPPAAAHGWTLRLAISAGEFVRSAHLEADGKPVADASIFRLPNLPEDGTTIDVPADAARAQRLRLTLEGEGGGYLSPGFSWTSSRELDGASSIGTPLTVLSTRSADGNTIVELARPLGLLPREIALTNGTSVYDRTVEIWDDGAGAGATGKLGEARIFRLGTSTPIASKQRIAIATPHGDRLRVVIHDGDSPPLADLQVMAWLREPSLVFALPTATGTLAWGGGRAWTPEYDLTGLLDSTAFGEQAKALTSLYDPKTTCTVTVAGAPQANPLYDASPALGFAMNPGAPVDPRDFRRARPLTVPAAPEGLSELTLSPDDLAATRADLADMRVVDGDGKQWPYLLERRASTSWSPLPVEATSRKDGVTTYPLALPATPFTLDQLVIDGSAPFFDRAYRLLGRGEGDESDREIASGRLVRRANDPRPVVIAFDAQRLTSLALEVTDGDDAPLQIEAKARSPLPAIYLVAPSGRYRLLLGDPEAKPPQYELATVRDVVLAVKSEPIAADPLGDNADFRRGRRLAEGDAPMKIAMWAALGIAVLALGAMTMRLARKEEAAEPAPAAPKPGAPAPGDKAA